MNEKVKEILDVFEEINKVPRQSKNEEKISRWLVDWGKKNGFNVKTDEAMNVLIEVPATEGHEDKPALVLQGHMDMVCEKVPSSEHDFSKDPIKHVMVGDWMKADGTTLGADNGIAIAISLVAAKDKSIVHPPLELLFTVDEETGLTGANALQKGWVKGKILLNLDSEDEGIFTVGCAGGRDTTITYDPLWKPFSDDREVMTLKVAGLSGGHSGVDIALPKANANIILARVLETISKITPVKIGYIKGGSAHNAIPRDAEAVISIKSAHRDEVVRKVEDITAKIKSENAKNEAGLEITFRGNTPFNDMMLSVPDSMKLIDMMIAIPHGVASMSTDIDGLVETSNNFATVRFENESVKILSSQRSSVASKLDWITSKVEKSARVADAEAVSGNGYPGWEPNMDSEVLKKCVSIYEKMYGKKPVVEVIHAGLECGIIGSKNEGMDMISYGPTIKNPHSPDEKMYVPSIEKIWDFTVELMKSYCQ